MKPSLGFMRGGMEAGDTWKSIDNEKWLYKGNSRSNFNRFYNDYWMTVSRGDNMFLMLFVAIWHFALTGVHYFLKSSWTGIFFTIGVLVTMALLFYSTITFLSSLKEFICYKKEYNSVYQKWLNTNSERRRIYIGG